MLSTTTLLKRALRARIFLKVSAAEAGVRSRLRPVQRLAVPPCPRVQHHRLRHPFPVIPMHRSLAILVLALAVTVVDDVRAQGISPARIPLGQELPSITLPPSLDRVLREYEAAWRKGDAAGLAALFAEDGFVLQSGRAPARGRAAIQAVYTGQGGAPLRLRALAASVADTVGFIVGAYGYGTQPGDQGKFTLTLRRRAGGPWLIFSDMDNTTRPPG